MPLLAKLLSDAPTFLVIGNVALLVILLLRPALLEVRGGKVLVVLAFIVFPIAVTRFGLSTHLQQSKTTRFCLSCHVMEPYGKSLLVDSLDHIPARHFQNRLVPRDVACFTCHTTYTMFGDYRAKLRGVRHLYVNYLGQIPKTLRLYEPFSNRECLHCHDGARTFEGQAIHQGLRGDIESDNVSCLSCHSVIHDLDHLGGTKLWKPWDDGRSLLRAGQRG